MLEGGSSRSYLHAMRVECQVSHIMFECGAERDAMSDEQRPTQLGRECCGATVGRQIAQHVAMAWYMYASNPTCTYGTGR